MTGISMSITENESYPQPYKQLVQQLNSVNSALNVTELQGCLVGLCCGGLTQKSSEWLGHLSQLIAEEKALPEELVATLRQLQQSICEQLKGDLFNLKLFIQEELADKSKQLLSLKNWCEGWLLGFGLSHGDKKLSTEAREGLADIRDISQVETTIEEVDDDEFEREIFAVISHIKVIVEMIFLELNQSSASPAILNAAAQYSNNIH